jgi:Serpentine type 7TM GPCR chemoreceptor Srh
MVIETFDILLFTLTSISMALQLFVLYMVYAKSPSSMKEYKHLLALTTALDLQFTALFGFLLDPHIVFPSILITINGPLIYGGRTAVYIGVSAVLEAIDIAPQKRCLPNSNHSGYTCGNHDVRRTRLPDILLTLSSGSGQSTQATLPTVAVEPRYYLDSAHRLSSTRRSHFLCCLLGASLLGGGNRLFHSAPIYFPGI